MRCAFIQSQIAQSSIGELTSQYDRFHEAESCHYRIIQNHAPECALFTMPNYHSKTAAPDIGQLAPEPDAGLNINLFLQSDIGQSGICEGTTVHSPSFVLPVIPV